MTSNEENLLARIPQENILSVTIYTRSMPVCHFCNTAKMTLKKNFPGITVREIDISTGKGNEHSWSKLLQVKPSIRSIPQIFIHYETDSEPREIHLGGESELAKICEARKHYETK
jgi:glutaredoxin